MYQKDIRYLDVLFHLTPGFGQTSKTKTYYEITLYKKLPAYTIFEENYYIY